MTFELVQRVMSSHDGWQNCKMMSSSCNAVKLTEFMQSSCEGCRAHAGLSSSRGVVELVVGDLA